ncbi:MAG: subunit SecD of preprotein translocase [Paenibacillaceae bacterium]|jgi:SecD/SecF fusion protein|nr:subunit SecD of preprotein translocase [Paenibacillaceae bacterium]
MDVKKLVAFVLIAIIIFAAAGITGPIFAKKMKLGLDLKGGFEILYQAEPVEEGQAVTSESLRETARSVAQRANSHGVSEPEVNPEGKDRIRVRIAGVVNENEVREILKKPAELTFRGPDGTKEMLGSDFVENGASIAYDQVGRPEIIVKVKDPAKLKTVTEKLIGKPLAIYLDENEISAPVVQSVIADGTASITGNYSYEEAKNLRDTINLGALPLKLSEKYTQSVGATLGLQSLSKTVEAGALAFVLILLFMLVFYRVPGFVACVTLISYVWLLLVVFYLVNVTLTLPGIAAFVLGIGMAVDANVITYERIKEEMRSGKSVLSSLKAGSKMSFRAIIDAHMTTLIAGLVLYYIGTGAIQGFALTLIFSILLSLLTNVFFSRLLLQLLLRSNIVKKPVYFGVKESEIDAL